MNFRVKNLAPRRLFAFDLGVTGRNILIVFLAAGLLFIQPPARWRLPLNQYSDVTYLILMIRFLLGRQQRDACPGLVPVLVEEDQICSQRCFVFSAKAV